MQKKVLTILILSILLLLTSGNNADARRLEPSLGPYMTDEASAIQKDTFGWNETPFAFLQFDVNDLNTRKPLFVRWTWRLEDNHFISRESEKITNFSNAPLNLWNSLDNWDIHKSHGEWTVKVAWWNPGGGRGSQKVNFTVTPEPLSSLLFLTGALTLAARCYSKKRKKSLTISLKRL